jgi:4'-phosphopantetheinyl transferase EntD
MPDAAAFAAQLRAVLPPGVSLGAADPARLHPLAQGEGIAGAVPARLAEYSAGRAAARTALLRPDQPIPMGADRAPIWPPGVVGSITHCAGLCLAIVSKDTEFQGLGLDAEPMSPVAPDLWDSILRQDEMATDGIAVLKHFVAKEAAYKAQYAVTKHLFGFHTLRLHFDGDRFSAEFCAPVAPFVKGAILRGEWVSSPKYLGALVAIRSPAPGV